MLRRHEGAPVSVGCCGCWITSMDFRRDARGAARRVRRQQFGEAIAERSAGRDALNATGLAAVIAAAGDESQFEGVAHWDRWRTWSF